MIQKKSYRFGIAIEHHGMKSAKEKVTTWRSILGSLSKADRLHLEVRRRCPEGSMYEPSPDNHLPANGKTLKLGDVNTVAIWPTEPLQLILRAAPYIYLYDQYKITKSLSILEEAENFTRTKHLRKLRMEECYQDRGTPTHI